MICMQILEFDKKNDIFEGNSMCNTIIMTTNEVIFCNHKSGGSLNLIHEKNRLLAKC